MENKRKGAAGERTAAIFLRNSGCKILTTNFKSKLGEIDIIALDGKTIVFIEVKTRSNLRYGSPAEAVSVLKQKRIIHTATCYLSATNKTDLPCRFDVIEVFLSDGNIKCNHIKDAFGNYS